MIYKYMFMVEVTVLLKGFSFGCLGECIKVVSLTRQSSPTCSATMKTFEGDRSPFQRKE